MTYFASGDGPFYFKEQLSSLTWTPQIWNAAKDFGENVLPRLWIDYPFRLIVKLLSSLGVSWWLIEKLLWGIVIILGGIGIYRLTTYIAGKTAAYLAILLYLTNTYALFLFGGGQLGVAFAYGFAPFVLSAFMQTIDTQKTNGFVSGMRNGLLLSLLIVFDLRYAYLIMGAVCIYAALKLKRLVSYIHVIFLPVCIAVLVHAFWILPTVRTGIGSAGMGEPFTSPGMLQFLSFADLPHAIALLHPNWPENLFGKVYFLQPEFLIIPILAFAALFLIRELKTKKHIVFLSVLSLIGAFFAKGINPPIPELFAWCFSHIPGFVMFRDPTKFYLFTAIGYSVLIPFVISQIATHMKSMKWLPYAACMLFWCFTIRPLFLGTLSGNFKPKEISAEYVRLKDALVADVTPSRSLWIPGKEKFAYASDTHPALTADVLYTGASLSGMLTIATSSSFMTQLDTAGVRYVVVPEDVERTLFMTDYAFDPVLRNTLIQTLEKTRLHRLPEYQTIAVFENPSFSGIRQVIPDIVAKQQYFSGIGLVISSISLVFFIILVCM